MGWEVEVTDDMAGHRPFSELTKDWSAERRARYAARKAELDAQYATLEELRLALGLSQEELARLLDVQQPAVSKLVGRRDMRLSTLRELIAAMGGTLKITAEFPDHAVELTSLGGGIEPEPQQRRRSAV